MNRAPFQVLVLPFMTRPDGQALFAVFRRADTGDWQGIAGAGQDAETPEQAARREAQEEAGTPAGAGLFRLDSVASIPAAEFSGSAAWGASVLVIPEYSFALRLADPTLRLSAEHTAAEWLDFSTAHGRLRWDSNRTALWEIQERIRRGLPV